MRGRAVALVAAVMLAACSPAKDIASAKQAVAGFHQQLNAAQFDAIYDASSADLKAATSKAANAQFLSAVHTKLGAFQSGDVVGFIDNVTNGRHVVTLNYASKYAAGGATERFSYRVDGDRLTLAGYHIDSNALILK